MDNVGESKVAQGFELPVFKLLSSHRAKLSLKQITRMKTSGHVARTNRKERKDEHVCDQNISNVSRKTRTVIQVTPIFLHKMDE